LNFISYNELSKDVLKLIPFCLDNDISAIYACPRSGLLPATMLATELHLPCGVAGESLHMGTRLKIYPRIGKGPALLIDDSVNKGTSINRASSKLNDIPHLKACVYINPKNRKKNRVDFACKTLETPRLFQWNIFNSQFVANTMFDLDGVFCIDPPVFDDDGVEYQNYLSNAIPLHQTTWPIGWIVTNRLEIWRDITGKWLHTHGIKIKHKMYMQPYNTAAERRAKSNTALYKADIYNSTADALLFVESSDKQASRIFSSTKKPVLSIEKMKLYK